MYDDIYLLVLFFLLFFIFQASSNIAFKKFRREGEFDGYRCAPGQTLFETKNISDATGCAKICKKNDFCYSFFFQEDLRVCIGCDGFYHRSEGLSGSQYFGRYSGKCTPGWVAHKESKRCYFFSPDKKQRSGLNLACEPMNGMLVEVDDDTELDYLRSMTSNSDKVYLIRRIFQKTGFWYRYKNGVNHCWRIDFETKVYIELDCNEPVNYICERQRSFY